MYPILLSLHSLVRWLVVVSLLLSLVVAYRGWIQRKSFTKANNSLRHWTATIAHIQLILGVSIYFLSPIITYFWENYHDALHQRALRFFGMEHSLMMLVAIVIVTIGSAKAKRKKTDLDKFKTIAIWYTIGLVIILVNVPWPFSPFAARPLFRLF